MSQSYLNPPGLTNPTGYAHVAIVPAGRQLHISGQVALNAKGEVVGKGDLAAQAEQVYANLDTALKAAGATWANVFKLVTYVVDLTPDKAAPIRAVRRKYLGDLPSPASTMVGVTSLVHQDLLLEVELIARID
jgi:enamine deaminase RidA (YjgF/YER057c/UK114 family)